MARCGTNLLHDHHLYLPCRFPSTTAVISPNPTPLTPSNPNLSISSPQTLPLPHLPIERLFVPPEVVLSSSAPVRILTGSNIVLGPYAKGAGVTAAEFVKSSVRKEDCPTDGSPEFALVGRSNVGKSSLLNSLVRRKKLALTSKKPDASIPAKKIDLEYVSWLGENKIPTTLIFTKCDKRKKKKHGGMRPEENVEAFQNLIRDFFETTPPWIMTSTVTNQGRDEILLHIAQLRNYWLKH